MGHRPQQAPRNLCGSMLGGRRDVVTERRHLIRLQPNQNTWAHSLVAERGAWAVLMIPDSQDFCFMSYCNYLEARLVSQSPPRGAACALAMGLWGHMHVNHGCAATSDPARTGASPVQIHLFEALCTEPLLGNSELLWKDPRYLLATRLKHQLMRLMEKHWPGPGINGRFPGRNYTGKLTWSLLSGISGFLYNCAWRIFSARPYTAFTSTFP